MPSRTLKTPKTFRYAPMSIIAVLAVLAAGTSSVGLASEPAAAPASPQPDPTLSGKEIVQKMLDQNRIGFESGQATIWMKLKTKQGAILDRKMLARANNKGGLQQTRMTFLEPEDQRGIEVLLLEQKSGADLQYVWLPRLKSKRRMGGAAKNGRFQGSDFTYADLESRDIKSGTYKRLPDATYGKKNPKPVYRVDTTPKPGVDQQYSRVELWVDVKTMLPFKTIFYDRAGKKLKVLKTRRIKKLNGRYVPTKVTMKNVQEHSETVIEVGKINSNAKYPPSLFSPDALGK